MERTKMGEIRNKRIFITGGAGFIASHLIERLIEKNRIVVYDNFSRNAIKFIDYSQKNCLKVIHGDILDDSLLRKSVKGCQIFIHCAAIAGIYTVGKNTSRTIRVNLLGTSNLLEAVKDLKLERFIDFSSSEVYGPFTYKGTEMDLTTQGPVNENRWAYAVSKLASENLTYSYFQEYKVPAVIVRPFNIYGPRQIGEGAIQRMITQCLNHKPLILYNNGTQIRAWCYVEDLVKGILACLTKKKAVGQIFNIGNPQGAVTNIKLAKTIKRLTQSDSKIRFRLHPGPEVQVRVPSIEKAKKVLGFQPAIGLEEGLLKTIDWYRRYRV
jgi:dTDP-glucose 4,6-dehydratase